MFVDDLPPPPLDIPPPLNLVDNEYHTHASEEDLPPPPSPVSSSYSELRRATDNTYPSMPTYPVSQNNYQHLNVSMGSRNSDIGGEGNMAGNHHLSGSGISHNDLIQQKYANNYQPDYGTYVPSSQVNYVAVSEVNLRKTLELLLGKCAYFDNKTCFLFTLCIQSVNSDYACFGSSQVS